METKANYTIVGLFTVIVIFLAFGFVYWMSEYRRGDDMVNMVLKIPGSANGLSVGSAVRFNGIPVGSVRALNFDAGDPRYSMALIEIRADAPVYPDTRAVLEIQGLTGTSYIELSGGTTSKEQILKTARDTGKPARLNAEQSSVTNLLATASAIMNRADKTLVGIQGFVDNNSGPLTTTISNVETFSEALKKNADGIDGFLKSVSDLSATVSGLSGRLDGTLASVDNLVKAVDAKKIDAVLANAETVSADLAKASGQVQGTIDGINRAVANFEDFGKNANATLDKADKVLAAIDPAKLGQSVDDAQKAIADARTAIESVKGVANTIGGRQADIDTIITNVRDMSDKLNAASTRVDGVLAKVDSFLGSGDSSSLFAEAKKTMESFRQVADTLNARIGPIADNLQRFSSSGLSEIRGLVDDTRRTMQTLDNAVSRLDADPQRLLFGGDEVKTYNGRARR